jgi:regulator of protease activity HflC (stomatin/prohibitin superfamily)
MFAYKVHEKEAVILEKFGKFVAVKDQPGLRSKMPGKFLKVAARVPLNVTQHEINLETKTKDNIFATVPTTLHLQVVDPKAFHYNANGNTYDQAGSKIIAVMKQLTTNMDFDHLYQARETLGNDVRDKVGKEIEELYGLKIVDVIVDQPVAPQSVQQAYNSSKSSEQTAKATLNAAQANKQTMIMDAEARKEALRLDGEGVAEQRAAMFKNLTDQYNTLVNGGMDKSMAEKLLIKMMELDTLRDVSKGGNVIVTTTADKDPITDTQTALRAAAKNAQPPAPKP